MLSYVDAVNLKDRLSEIETDGCDRHDISPEAGWGDQLISAIGAEAVHAIKWQTQNSYTLVDACARIDHAEPDPILSISTEAA